MKPTLAMIGLSCAWATVSLAQPANSHGLEGGMTAYQFDGTYKGTAQQVAENHASCRSGQDVALEVHAGRLKLDWTEQQAFEAKVLRDGSFFATTEPVVQAEKHMSIVPTLQGHMTPTGLVADYGTRWCRYRLDATQLITQQRLSQRTDGPGARP